MGNKRSSLNYPKAAHGHHEQRSPYNTPGYYRSNRGLTGPDRQEGSAEAANYADANYDDLNTGKYEHYEGGGYYGSNYGYVNQRAGRDYEQNAGYRDNYNRLPTEPAIRGFSREESRVPEGGHRGKGPRNYTRSDARIREDINDLLCEDPYVDASEIEVLVENGEVTLTGTVDDKNAKRRAEELLDNVHGIKHLENRLRTRVPGNRILGVGSSGH